MNEKTVSKLLGICCQNTCGCGNQMIKYDGERSYKDWFLTCKPFSEKYSHPMKVRIPKNCQLLKDHHMIELIRELLNSHDGNLTKDVQNILDNQCDFCWEPENTTYEYETCPKCERVL